MFCMCARARVWLFFMAYALMATTCNVCFQRLTSLLNQIDGFLVSWKHGGDDFCGGDRGVYGPAEDEGWHVWNVVRLEIKEGSFTWDRYVVVDLMCTDG